MLYVKNSRHHTRQYRHELLLTSILTSLKTAWKPRGPITAGTGDETARIIAEEFNPQVVLSQFLFNEMTKYPATSEKTTAAVTVSLS